MKRIINIIVLFAAAVLPSVSCSEAEAPEVPKPSVAAPVLHATIETPGCGTKVFADENLSVCWNEYDYISVFDHLTFNNTYEFAGEAGKPYGDFALVPENDPFYTGNELPYTYAVYPYSNQNYIGVWYDLPWLWISLPRIQYYVSNSFWSSANLMVSATEDNNLKFKNVCGYLMLKLYGDDINVSNVTLSANGREGLCGGMYVSMVPGEVPVIERFLQEGSSLAIMCTSPVKLGSTAEEATEFWFVVPPVTMASGFTVTVTTDNGLTFSAQRSASVTISRNTLTRMAPVEVTVPKPQYFLNPQTEEPAVFTLNEGWWGETHTAKMTYIEQDGIRYCTFISNEPGKGVWGDTVNTTFNFNWYLNENNSEGNNLLEVEGSYLGWDYNSRSYIPEDEAIQPLYAYDWYWYHRKERNTNLAGTWLTYAHYLGNPDGEYPAGYYDGNGGFYFNLHYYVHNTGGWNNEPLYDFVAISEGFDRSANATE